MKGLGPVTFIVLAAVAGLALVLRAAGRGGARSSSEASTSAPAGGQGSGRVVYSKSGYDITPLTQQRIEELAANLTP
ncbi:MAG: hypothetical protein HY718_19620, partial [Planctomycetes bacterium]|nr:hypothetical protein [Planctomycetota bacterium]